MPGRFNEYKVCIMARKENSVLVRYNQIKDPQFAAFIDCVKGTREVSEYISLLLKIYLMHGKVYPVVIGDFRVSEGVPLRKEQNMLLDKMALSELENFCSKNGLKKPATVRDIVSRFVVFDECPVHIVMEIDELRQKFIGLSNNSSKFAEKSNINPNIAVNTRVSEVSNMADLPAEVPPIVSAETVKGTVEEGVSQMKKREDSSKGDAVDMLLNWFKTS